jgi:hypothetical protein
LLKRWIVWQWHLAQERPDKSTKLTSDGHEGFLPTDPPLHERPEAAMEPGLRFLTQLLDRLRLILLAIA